MLVGRLEPARPGRTVSGAKRVFIDDSVDSGSLLQDVTQAVCGCGLRFPGCTAVCRQACEDERDVMVPGEQLRHAAPPPQGDDLRRPRGL